MKRRALLHGGNALLLTIAVIGSAVVGYVLVDRFRPFRIDVTRSGMHSLAPKTLEILARLDREVEVTYFEMPRELGQEVAFVNSRVTDLLEEFQVRSKGKIRHSISNPMRDELLLQELGGDLGAAVFQAGEQKIVVQAKEIFRTSEYDMGDGGGTKFTGEEAFDAALLQLMEGKSRTACFLAGHGEASVDSREELGFAYAKELLRRENFESREVRLGGASDTGSEDAKLEKPIALDAAAPDAALATGSIPADCTVLVIPGPSASIPAAHADAVAAYFERGNGVVLLAEPLTSSGVEKLAAKLGVEILPGVAADPTSQKRSPLTIIPGFGRHEIVNDLVAAQLPVILQKAVGMRAPAVADPKTKLTSLLETTENGLELVDIKDGVADPTSERNIKGPIVVAFAIERTISESEGQSKIARAVVIGDADFGRNASIEALSQQVGPGNVDLLKNAVSWAAGASDRIGIGPKDPDYDTVTISDRGALWVLFATGILLPFGIFGTGVSVWLRRRRR